MSDTSQQIRDRIEEFVNQLNQLVRQTALESVQDALGSGAGAGRGRGRGAARAAIGRGARRKGEKRSSDQIAETTKAVTTYVRKNPGQGVEAIAKGLGTVTKELTLPIRKLVAERQLKTKGQKRATKYFVR
jgi:ElaB/YqjD/DUF883 family membrane-anchored ribosome-binding protein